MNLPKTHQRLFRLSAVFLFIFSLILTISPAVRERNWLVDYRWDHWIGFAIWLVLTMVVHHVTAHWRPDTDLILILIASLLSGWGILTIWRLDPYFGVRQATWLVVAVCVFILALRIPIHLAFLSHYKYLILLSGILLTALTLVFGSNPSGYGPRLWIGGTDMFLQPSEPLKLLLVIYLAAYFAEHPPLERLSTQGGKTSHQIVSIPLIIPTIVMTGLSLLILFIQRDLGTASIFLLIYAIILFLVTGKRRILIITAAGLGLAALVGFFFVEIIRTRLECLAESVGRPHWQLVSNHPIFIVHR